MSVSFRAALLTLAAAGQTAAADSWGRWIGEDPAGRHVELRRASPGSWQLYVNGRPGLTLRSLSEGRASALLRADSGMRYSIGWTEVLAARPGTAAYSRVFRGGWHEGGFAKIGPLSTHFHGRYAGHGNRGGVPVDAWDRACQRHDIGYTVEGRWDGRVDARFVVESYAAGLNPMNDMKPWGRIKSIPAATAFTLKPGVYRTRPILGWRIPIPVAGPEKLPYYAIEEGWNGAVKPAAKATGRAAQAAAKPVGLAVSSAAKKAGRAAKSAGRRVKTLFRKVF